MKTLALLSVALITTASVQAAIIPFDLIGTAGAGLLPGNEPGSISGGTGGEIGAGIFFDDVALQLTVNVGWGSSQGFTDLSSTASASHIHGPTPTNFGNGFTEAVGVFANLTRSSNLTTGGTITQVVNYNALQAADLMSGKHYINIHTTTNGGGEMRGFLIPVPEPSTVVLAGAGLLGLLSRRSRKA